MDLNKAKIAAGIKQLRMEKGYTQEYVSEVLGKNDYTAYYRLEAGKTELKFEDAWHLAMLYKVPMEHIYDPELRSEKVESFEDVREKYFPKNRMNISITLDGEEATLTRQLELLRAVNAILAEKN